MHYYSDSQTVVCKVSRHIGVEIAPTHFEFSLKDGVTRDIVMKSIGDKAIHFNYTVLDHDSWDLFYNILFQNFKLRNIINKYENMKYCIGNYVLIIVSFLFLIITHQKQQSAFSQTDFL